MVTYIITTRHPVRSKHEAGPADAVVRINRGGGIEDDDSEPDKPEDDNNVSARYAIFYSAHRQ